MVSVSTCALPAVISLELRMLPPMLMARTGVEGPLTSAALHAAASRFATAAVSERHRAAQRSPATLYMP